MKNRLLSVCLVFCIVFTLFPAAALADEAEPEPSDPALCTQDEFCQAEQHIKGCPLSGNSEIDGPGDGEADQEGSAPDAEPEEGEQPPVEDEPGDEDADPEPPAEDAQPIPAVEEDAQPSPYDTTLVVSSEPGAFSDIQSALDSLDNSQGGCGSVLLLINENLKPGQGAELSVPADKGITSLTVATEQADGVTIGSTNAQFYLYANGVPLIIDTGVTLPRFSSNIFGGGRQYVAGDTSITIQEGAAVSGVIYGGGRDAGVGGDVSVQVYGTAGTIYGGGYAYAYTDDGDKRVTANVDGGVSILIQGDNSEVTGDLYGGGYVYSSSGKQAEQTLTANVAGGVEILLDSPNLNLSGTIYGGGRADIAYQVYGEDATLLYEGRHLTADVEGGVSIQFTGAAKSSRDPTHATMTVYGGGYANIQTSASIPAARDISVSAQVTGGVIIDASQNDYAKDSGADDWDGSMFQSLYGGGHTSGRQANASVTGDVSITTARKAVDSERGVFGGGYAQGDGVARVNGNIVVTVCRADGQKSGHENAKGVFGGGCATADGDATVDGDVKVIIGDDISFESSGKGIVGGGYNASTTKGRADVTGTVTVEIGSNLFINRNMLIGGGYMSRQNTGGTAAAGAVVLSLTDTSTGNVYGGGYNMGGGTVSAGSVRITLDNCTAGYLYGGGYGSGSGTISVGSVEITLDDSESNWVYPVGKQVTVTGDATLDLLGASTLSGCRIKSGDSGTLDGVFHILVGDGVKETNAASNSNLYSDKDTYVTISENAVLSGINTQYALLWNVKRVDIARTGKLVLTKEQDIAGDLSGTGAIALPAGLESSVFPLIVRGDFTGSIILEPAPDTRRSGAAWTKQDTSGVFVYEGDGYILVPYTSDPWHRWDMVEAKTVTASVTNPEGGSATPGRQKVLVGGSAVITIACNPGYELSGVTVGGQSYADRVVDGTLTLNDVQEDTAVAVTFAPVSVPVTHSVTAAVSGGGGSVSPSAVTVEDGGSAELIITCEPGYQLSRVTVNSLDRTQAVADGKLLLEDIREDISVSVAFAPVSVPVVHTVTATVSGSGGSVLPSAVTVEDGGSAELTITRDPGFKLSRITVNGADRTLTVAGDKLLLENIREDTAVAAAFEVMTPDDVKDALPPIEADKPVEDETDRNTILDTKIDYEALKDNQQLSPEEAEEASKKLHEALAALPNIEVKVEVETENTAPVQLHNGPALLENMTQQEAQALKNSEIEEYKIVVTIAALTSADEKIEASINGVLDGAVKSVLHDVTVKKLIDGREPGGDGAIHELASPIQFTFQIPDELLNIPSGTTRSFAMLHTHQDGTEYKTSVLDDLDDDPATYTVNSDRFSVYTLVYTDTVTGGGGHSGGVTTYPVSIPAAAANGSISATPKNAVPGSTVTITVKPDEGYVLDALTAADSRGNPLKLTDLGNGRYTFIMPSSRAAVSVSFVRAEAPQEKWPFTDVTPDDWFYDAAVYLYGRELMAGTSDTTFSPSLPTTRGMIVTLLHRLAGEPAADGASFPDVAEGQYYSRAVAWAAANSVVLGYTNGSFGPDDPITREQLAAILYRFVGSPAVTGGLSAFPDASGVSAYAREAMIWAVQAGLITGLGDGTLDPQGSATRAQAAVILMRYCLLYQQ